MGRRYRMRCRRSVDRAGDGTAVGDCHARLGRTRMWSVLFVRGCCVGGGTWLCEEDRFRVGATVGNGVFLMRHGHM